MATKDKIARRKLSLLDLASELSNVSRACKVMGYSRQQFYKIRRNFQTYGAEDLIDRLRHVLAKGPQHLLNRRDEGVLMLWQKLFDHRGWLAVRGHIMAVGASSYLPTEQFGGLGPPLDDALTACGVIARLSKLPRRLMLWNIGLLVIRAAEKARASMTTLEAEIRKLRDTFARTGVTELAQAVDKANLASKDLHKVNRRLELLQLRAPVAGTVQQLALATVGGVVQPAQPLMIIVPDGAEIEVEAHVMNKGIGFVREGQPVRVKLEAFPFTVYGLMPDIVADISRDAVDLLQSSTPQRDDNAPDPSVV